jgi:hypothetical protein
MARILDFYAVQWAYEPVTFPILWNLDGEVIESFSPDFYLPDLDMFLEMTTLKQRLVRKKNRKLRRLRELYPDIRIKLFYARDFRQMMLKYGRFGLLESLSGTSGQVMPERAARMVAALPEPSPEEVAAVAAAPELDAAAELVLLAELAQTAEMAGTAGPSDDVEAASANDAGGEAPPGSPTQRPRSRPSSRARRRRRRAAGIEPSATGTKRSDGAAR